MDRLKIVFVIFVLSVVCCDGYWLCSSLDGEWIKSVKVNITNSEYRIVDVGEDLNEPALTTHFQVDWEVLKEGEAADKDIDGFIVSLIEKNTYPRQTLYPTESRSGTCNKYLKDHIFLSTLGHDECDKMGPCGEACVCDINDCDVINETICDGPKDYMGKRNAGNPFTVSAKTRSLTFEIKLATPYELMLIPYYREFYDNGIPSTPHIPDLCPELVSKIRGYNIDDGYELCCRKGYRDTYIRSISMSPPVPDFNTWTFNSTMIFTNMFYNDTSYSLNLPVAESPYDQFALYDTNIRRIGPAPLLFESGIMKQCLDQESLFAVTIYSLKKTEKYQVHLFPHFVTRCTHACYATHTFTVPDVDTCEWKWGYCDDHALCSNTTGYEFNTTCQCQQGYEGNGIKNSFANNTTNAVGCTNIDSCHNDSCVENAFCTDNPPPMTNFTCECADGFYGSGYIGEAGCKPIYVIVLAVVIPAVAILFIIIAIVVWRIYMAKQQKRDLMFSIFNVDTANGILCSLNEDVEGAKLTEGPWEPTFEEKWEIDRSKLELGGIIGRGNYGVVYNGKYFIPPPPYESITRPFNEKNANDNVVYEDIAEELEVAVKTLQDSHVSHANLREFLSEIGFLINVGKHENIVHIHGCCTTDKPVYLITEFLKYGNLLHFLWDARETNNSEHDPIYNVTETSLLQMAKGVAKGMEHLSKLRIIHGDIAARNILVGEKGVCKISDFGLANDVYRCGSFHGHSERVVPFKWISPERMMDGKVPITYKSDVWSFGILLYEMFTLGCAPHSTIHADDLLQKLMDGYRMAQPKSCSDDVYDLMQKCWKWRASSRPNFTQIRKNIETMICKENKILFVDGNNAGDLNRQAYEDDIAKYKGSRTYSHVDEGFEENCSNACSTGDVSIVTHSDDADSGQDEPPKYVEDLKL